jgi:hypothetical protein
MKRRQRRGAGRATLLGGATLATMTDAAALWLGARASYLSPPELLAEALLLRGFHSRIENGRLRVILDHPSDRAALAGILELGADGRVRSPAGAAAPGPGGEDLAVKGLDAGNPWHLAASAVVASGHAACAPASAPEDGWGQFRARNRWRPPPVAAARSLDLGVALLVRALCLLDCKVLQGCDGHAPGPGREIAGEARIELASPWDAILAETLVNVGAGGWPPQWQWTYRTIHVPHAAGQDAGGLARTLGDLQRIARALLDHPHWGMLRKVRARAVAEHGAGEPNPEAFRAALRRRMLPETAGG